MANQPVSRRQFLRWASAPVLQEDARIRELEDTIRTLRWIADTEREKHRRATQRLHQLGERLALLEAELAERERRVRELEESLAAERQAWAEEMARALAHREPGTARRLPLEGQRVALVGGDPFAPGAIAALEAMGAQVAFCPGYDQLNRVATTVEAADLVVAVTSYMAHKHVEALKQALARSRARVIWVHTTGLSGFRRTLEQQLKAG